MKLIKTTFAAATLTLLFSNTASAWVLCAQGKIQAMEYAWADEGALRIATEQMPGEYNTYLHVPGLGPMIEMGPGGPTPTYRWTDRLRILDRALAQQLPVQILSRGKNCLGSIDDFDIAVCTSASRCQGPR